MSYANQFSTTKILGIALFFATQIPLITNASAAATPPACPASSLPADWARHEQPAFGMRLPTGFSYRQIPVLLDFEAGVYEWPERSITFQYGFAVDQLGGLEEDPATEICTFDVAGRSVKFLKFRRDTGAYGFGFHIPELTAGYASGERLDDLSIVGLGGSRAVQDEGLALLGALRFSHIPAAARGLWSTRGAEYQGLSVHVGEKLVSATWVTYSPDTGKPLWLLGIGNLPDVTYLDRATQDGPKLSSVQMTLYTSPQGSFPGRVGPVPALQTWGSAELRIHDGCIHGDLVFDGPGSVSGAMAIDLLTPMEGDCSRFDYPLN